ncbi:MAG: hypothetical protein HC903_05720 [Methylacidiphilales bacterium]|nr:hypothetical protein [Candidatus Methylacidiphilales bacterium]NJL80538.1 hypothetical protein [Richelia sp. SM2_1_7]
MSNHGSYGLGLYACILTMNTADGLFSHSCDNGEPLKFCGDIKLKSVVRFRLMPLTYRRIAEKFGRSR